MTRGIPRWRTTTCRAALGLLALTIAAPPRVSRAQAAHAAPVAESVMPRDPDLPIEGGPHVPIVDELAELIPPPLVEVAQARRLADAGRHAEAAEIYEALFAAHGAPQLLYHAGRAWAQAGQFVAAVELLRRYLERAGPVGDAVRTHVAAVAADVDARTLPLRLQVVEGPVGARQAVPAAALAGAQVELQSLLSGPGPRSRRSWVGVQAEAMRVDPGAWRLRLAVPGYVPIDQTRIVGADGALEVVLVRPSVTVELRLTPAKPTRRTQVRLTADDRAYVPAIEHTLRAATTTVTLSTGRWRIEATSRTRTGVLVATVLAGQPALEVAMRERSAAESPHFAKDRKALIASLTVLTVSLYGGIGLMLGGANKEKNATDRTKELLRDAGVDVDHDQAPDDAAKSALEAGYSTAAYHRDLRVGNDLAISGAVLAMGGFGAVLGMLPAMMGSRKRFAYIELGVGGALLAGSVPWFAWHMHRRNGQLAVVAPDGRVGPDGLDHAGHRIGSSMLLGAGLGLTLVPAIVLVADAARQRRRARGTSVAPWLAPGLAGLAIGGRF